MKPSEIIDKALTEVIPDESAWCQKAEINRSGQHCTLGALRKAVGAMLFSREVGGRFIGNYHLTGEQAAQLRPACEAIRVVLYPDDSPLSNNSSPEIAIFNDTHTYDECREVMEKARAALQEQGQ